MELKKKMFRLDFVVLFSIFLGLSSSVLAGRLMDQITHQFISFSMMVTILTMMLGMYICFSTAKKFVETIK